MRRLASFDSFDVVTVLRRQWLTGLFLIFIVAPVSFGHHVALGLAIRKAQGK